MFDWILSFMKFLDDHAGAISAIAAILIGIFTYMLYRATNELKAIGARQAEALTGLERPWLFIEKVRVERREGAPIKPELPNNWFISFIWRNVGRTPAVIEECAVKIEPKDELSEDPDYSNPSKFTCPSTVAAGADFETSKIGPGGDEKRVKDGNPINLTVYGRLTYTELNGTCHHTGFAMDVSPALPAASTHKNRRYEYFD